MLRWAGSTGSSGEHVGEAAGARPLSWWHAQAEAQSVSTPANGRLLGSETGNQSRQLGFDTASVASPVQAQSHLRSLSAGTISSLQRAALPASPYASAAASSALAGHLKQSFASRQPEPEPLEPHGDSRLLSASPRSGHVESRLSLLWGSDASQDIGYSRQLRFSEPLTVDRGHDHVPSGVLVQGQETEKTQMAKLRGQVEELLGMSRSALQELNMVAAGSVGGTGGAHGSAGSRELAGLECSLVSLTESVDKLVAAQGRETQLLEDRLERLEDEARIQVPLLASQTTSLRPGSPARSAGMSPEQLQRIQASALMPLDAASTAVEEARRRVGCIVTNLLPGAEKPDSETAAREAEIARLSGVVDLLQEQLRKAKDESNLLRKECEHFRGEASIFKSAVEQSRLEALQRHEEMDCLQKKHAEESLQRHEEIDCLQKKHVDKCKELMRLWSELEIAHGESTRLGCTIQDLQQQLKTSRHALVQAEKANAESMQDSQRTGDMVTHLKLQLRDAQLALERASCESLQHSEETNRLQQQHAAKCNELMSMWSQVEIADGESKKLGSIVHDLQQQLKNTRTSLIEAEKANAESLVQELRRQLQESHVALEKVLYCSPDFQAHVTAETQTDSAGGDPVLLHELQWQLKEGKMALQFAEQSREAECSNLKWQLQGSEKTLAVAEEFHQSECKGLMQQLERATKELSFADEAHQAEADTLQQQLIQQQEHTEKEMQHQSKANTEALEIAEEGWSRAQERIQKSQAESEELGNTARNLEEQLCSMRIALEFAERQQQEDQKAREAAQTTCEERFDRAQFELRQSDILRENWQEELRATEGALAIAESLKRAEYETYSSSLEVSQRKADDAHKTSECLASLVEELKEEIASLRGAADVSKIDQSQQTEGGREATNPETAGLRAAIHMLQDELASTKTSLMDAEQQLRERPSAKTLSLEAAALRATVCNLQSELATTKTSLMEAEGQLKELQSPKAPSVEVAGLRAAVHNLQSDLATTKAALREAELQLQGRQPQAEETAHFRETLQSELANTKAALVEAERKLSDKASGALPATRPSKPAIAVHKKSKLESTRGPRRHAGVMDDCLDPASGPARRVGVVARGMQCQMREGLIFDGDSDGSGEQAERGHVNSAPDRGDITSMSSWPESPLSGNQECSERYASFIENGSEARSPQMVSQAEAEQACDEAQQLRSLVQELEKELRTVKTAWLEAQQLSANEALASGTSQNAFADAEKWRSEAEEMCHQSAHFKLQLSEQEEHLKKAHLELSEKHSAANMQDAIAEVAKFRSEAKEATEKSAELNLQILQDLEKDEHSRCELKHALDDAAKWQTEAENVSAKSLQLSSQLVQFQEKHKDAHSELQSSLVEAERLRNEVADATAKSAGASSELSEVQEKFRDAQEALKKSEHLQEEGRQAMGAQTALLRDEIQEAHSQSKRLSLEVQDLKLQLQSSRLSLDDADSRYHELYTEFTTLQEEAGAARTESQRLGNVVQDLQLQLQKARKALEERDASYQALHMESTKGQAEAAGTSAENAKLRSEAEEARAESRQLGSQLEELQKRMHSAQLELKEAEHSLQEKQALELEVARAQAEADDAVAKMEELQSSMPEAASSEELENLRAKFKDARADCRRLRRETVQLQEAQSSSAELEAHMQAELGAARNELQSEAAECRKARVRERRRQSAQAIDAASLATDEAASGDMTWC